MSGFAQREPLSSVDSVNGSELKTCTTCSRVSRDTRSTVQNGLRLIRIRYGLPYSELPDLEPSGLSRFLLYLLSQGEPRAPVSFPRRQARRDSEGLCSLQRLQRRERWELAHSLSSIKRSLPAGCRRCTPSPRDAWERHAFSSSPPSSHEYLNYCRSKVLKLFHFGWDKDYDSFVESFVPKKSSRRHGESADSGRSEKEFRRGCRYPADTSPLTSRFKEVMSAGKARSLLIFDQRVDFLGPLHKMLYKHLSKEGWLLRGPPTVEKVSSVCQHQVQTSVDLVGATDNLPLDVADTILSALLAKSTLPGPLRLLALESLRPEVYTRKGVYRGTVGRGQMMGGYLSFPLLCLQSWLAASWATRHTVSNILVNGDDTLISSPLAVEASSYPAGFKLNLEKTIRASNVCEINSTCFLRGCKGRWREVRHLRRGGFLTDYPGMLHAAAAVRGSVKWSDAFVRSRIGKSWGFMPSQLGLHQASYAVHQRESTMARYRCTTHLPKGAQPSSELVREFGTPDPDERLAMAFHQLDNGREGGMERDVFCPSRGEIRRTYSYRKLPLRSFLSYRGKLRGLKAKNMSKRGPVDSYYVPASYESRRYLEACRRGTLWGCPVDV